MPVVLLLNGMESWDRVRLGLPPNLIACKTLQVPPVQRHRDAIVS